eukprot:COSAG01_NODE_43626_length_427_cov_235.140244_1_plen_57_part_10
MGGVGFRFDSRASQQRAAADAQTCYKRLVGSSLRSVANQLFLSSSSQQQRYSLMAVK